MSVKDLGLDDIKKLLESGHFDGFIDARENIYLEAKPTLPFDMNGGHETNVKLAKYAASFANRDGGYIICGLKTNEPTGTPRGVVIGLNLCSVKNFYQPEQIKNRIVQSTYPGIQAEVRWYPYDKSPELGVGVIHIPSQDKNRKFFYIRIRELDGKRLKRELFSVPIRGDGFTDWKEVDELYKLSNLGPRGLPDFYEGLSSQIEELKVMLAGYRGVPPEDDLQMKIDQI